MRILSRVAKCSALVASGALAIGVMQPIAASAGPPADSLMNLTQYVNPLIGTTFWPNLAAGLGTDGVHGSGYQANIAPGPQVPFGMVNFGPDMQRPSFNGSGGYTTGTDPNPSSIRVDFFSLTHLNGPGCPGAGSV